VDTGLSEAKGAKQQVGVYAGGRAASFNFPH